MSDTKQSTCPHFAAAELTPPRASQSVHKDECMLCFDSPVCSQLRSSPLTGQDSAAGIDVCLTCFQAGCCDGDPARSHAALHASKTGHTLALNIRRTPKPRQPLTKLAVVEESDEDRYDYRYEPRCYACDPHGRSVAPSAKVRGAHW